MKKSLLVLLGMSLLATSCGQKCKQAREQIITPVQTVENLLAKNPTGGELLSGGCSVMLAKLSGMDQNAAMVRQTAEEMFRDKFTTCERYETGIRQSCRQVPVYVDSYVRPNPHHGGAPSHPGYVPPPPAHGGYHNPPHGNTVHYKTVCYPETYTYCASYQYHDNAKPGYTDAVELSRSLDSLYAKANAVCELARIGETQKAEASAKDLYAYIAYEVRPRGQATYSRACGN